LKEKKIVLKNKKIQSDSNKNQLLLWKTFLELHILVKDLFVHEFVFWDQLQLILLIFWLIQNHKLFLIILF